MGKIGHIATHRALIDYCREVLQLDTERLIRSAGLDPQVFIDPDGTIDEVGRRALWTAAFALTRDPHLALRIPMFRTFAESDGLAGSAPTVGAAFEDQCEFWGWFDRSSQFHFPRTEDEVGVTIEMSDGSQVSRVRAQMGLADLFIGIRKVTGVPFVPVRVEFSTPRPRDVRVLEEVFACSDIRFGQEKDRLWLRAQDWAAAVRHNHHYLVQPQLSLQPQPQDASSLAAEVRRIVKDRIGNEPISLSRVARRLGTSARTLQRRLSEDGVSFADVVDSARKLRACTLLQGWTHSIAAITFLVGFSEQSAFTRAFRRWTGTTPARYRRVQRAPLGGGPEPSDAINRVRASA
jgi:AraC-like DNA-binding protein